MAVKVLPSSALRSQIAEVIKEVSQEGDACFITLHGKAQVVLLGVERFNHLMSLIEDVLDEQDAVLALRVKEARRNFRRGKGIPFRKSVKPS